SPSATVFAVCSDLGAKKQSDKPETLLGVADPAFDHSRPELMRLADLSAARREVKTIAAYYNAPRLLTGPQASKRQIEKAIAGADVAHFALHSIVDEHSPLLTKLVLAKAPVSGGDQEAAEFLRAYEVYPLDLTRTRLVVLSACQTAVSRYYQGEGMINI